VDILVLHVAGTALARTGNVSQTEKLRARTLSSCVFGGNNPARLGTVAIRAGRVLEWRRECFAL
jgi:hypothetical protein